MNYGVIRGEGVEQYHATEAFSSSKAKVFASSPLLYYRKYVGKTIPRDDESHALVIGHATHTLILEGEQAYSERFYVVPDGVGKQSKADKETRAILAQDNYGKTALEAEDDALNRKLMEVARNHPSAGPLLAKGVPEVSWRVKGKYHDVQARTDLWDEDNGVIVDLKTTASLKDDNPKSFKRAFWNLKYHLSAYLYREVVATVLKLAADAPRPRFVWVAVEKEEPFGCEVFEADDITYDLAGREVTGILKRLNECYATGIWPGSPPDIQILTPPGWLIRRDDK